MARICRKVSTLRCKLRRLKTERQQLWESKREFFGSNTEEPLNGISCWISMPNRGILWSCVFDIFSWRYVGFSQCSRRPHPSRLSGKSKQCDIDVQSRGDLIEFAGVKETKFVVIPCLWANFEFYRPNIGRTIRGYGGKSRTMFLLLAYWPNHFIWNKVDEIQL